MARVGAQFLPLKSATTKSERGLRLAAFRADGGVAKTAPPEERWFPDRRYAGKIRAFDLGFRVARQSGSSTVRLPRVNPMNAPITAILDRKGRNVFSVSPTMSIAEAVDEMNRHRVGSVLVIDGGRLVGIFTERDVLRRVVGAGVDPKRTAVADVMTADVITISPEATIDETMVLFTEKRLRHLPVCDNGRLVGTISIGDITRWMSDTHRAEAEHLKNYITSGFSA
jgi:CBS domain-containing protein